MSVPRFTRLLVAGLVAVSGLLVGCTPQAAKPPLRVGLWGDSMAFQTAPYFSFFINLSGRANARALTFPGTALCDWLPDMARQLDSANPLAFHPQAAVVVLSGTNGTPCMRDSSGRPYTGQALIDKYAADSAKAIALFARAKVPLYFASVPISRANDAAGMVGNTPLGVMYSTLPARYPGGFARFIDAAQAVEWHGHYTDTLPCLSWETCTGRWPDGTPTVIVREADGRHFCPAPEVPSSFLGIPMCPVPMPGAQRYALAITGRVLGDFHLS